jgi:hypothetical protein
MRSIVAWILGVALTVNGLAMLAAPAVWYAAVPGVSETGALNHHFIRDLGASWRDWRCRGLRLTGQRGQQRRPARRSS